MRAGASTFGGSVPDTRAVGERKTGGGTQSRGRARKATGRKGAGGREAARHPIDLGGMTAHERRTVGRLVRSISDQLDALAELLARVRTRSK